MKYIGVFTHTKEPKILKKKRKEKGPFNGNSFPRAHQNKTENLQKFLDRMKTPAQTIHVREEPYQILPVRKIRTVSITFSHLAISHVMHLMSRNGFPLPSRKRRIAFLFQRLFRLFPSLNRRSGQKNERIFSIAAAPM